MDGRGPDRGDADGATTTNGRVDAAAVVVVARRRGLVKPSTRHAELIFVLCINKEAKVNAIDGDSPREHIFLYIKNIT